MRLIAIILTVTGLVFISGCKKTPVDQMYLHLTFNGQTYGNTFCGIDGYNIALDRSDSMFGINALRGPVY
jgi:hypothetical protein